MKLVLFKGGVETQEYFSFELAKKFQKMGYEVFFYDLLDPWKSLAALEEFVETGNTVMFTFNFNGIGGEDGLYLAEEEDFVINADTSGKSTDNGHRCRCFWDTHEIPCFNMVVDHPYYYHHFIEKTPKRYYQISIDRAHEAYMKRFFPQAGLAGFVPLGGTRLITGEPLMPLVDRPMDIVFTGNYSRPETFDRYIEHLGPDYVEFYHSITDELIANPWIKLEDLAEKRLKEEIGYISDEDLKPCFRNMISIDLSVRFHYRAEAVKNLIDNGFKVNVYGAGWEALECRHPENLIRWGGVNSEKCLEVMNLSKLSLNVMPWFKEGAHDRIFNSMLNGALCLTDTSSYLLEEFTDGNELRFFELSEIDKISHITEEILADPKRMAEIADKGRMKAEQRHAWAHRAEAIDAMIKRII